MVKPSHCIRCKGLPEEGSLARAKPGSRGILSEAISWSLGVGRLEMHSILKYFSYIHAFTFLSFYSLREGWRGRRRRRKRSRLLVEQGAWCVAWSQDPGIMTWAKDRRLTDWATHTSQGELVKRCLTVCSYATLLMQRNIRSKCSCHFYFSLMAASCFGFGWHADFIGTIFKQQSTLIYFSFQKQGCQLLC